MTVSATVSFDGTPLLLRETRSVIETLPIGGNYSRIRWLELIVEGRLGGSYITVTSNRVYF
ncbi:MAG: hypothetical protein ACUVQZ_07050 [Candidatus Caldatribacteriaceae bacterium]